MPTISLNALGGGGGALQGKFRIKTWSKLKLHMDVGFNLDQLLEEESLKVNPLLLKARSSFKKKKRRPWLKKELRKNMRSL